MVESAGLGVDMARSSLKGSRALAGPVTIRKKRARTGRLDVCVCMSVRERGRREGRGVKMARSSRVPRSHPTPYTLHPAPYTSHPTPYV